MRGREKDRTGEVHNNREITGPGDLHRWPSGKVTREWFWKCLECGETGKSSSIENLRAHGHACKGKPKGRRGSYKRKENDAFPPKRADDEIQTRSVYDEACKGCTYRRKIGGRKEGFYACCYLLDTGKARPKVDLKKEKCPAYDPGDR